MSTVQGSCHVNSKCVLTAAAFVLGGAAVGYATAAGTGVLLVLLGVGAGLLIGYGIAKRSARVNCAQKLECDKVVDTVDMEDIGDKKVFCRCWKSKKFPYCDGAHNKHNVDTGDNVGPLIVTKTKPQ